MANLWYEKSNLFNYQQNSLQNCGTFTQLVWKNTKEIGVGISRKNGKIYIVALYSPPGNIIGAVTKNVFPPSASTSTVVDENNSEKSKLIKQIKQLLDTVEKTPF